MSIFFIFCLFCCSCATRAKQTEDWFSQTRDLKPLVQISDVPFVQQTAGFCGPATLTMAMNWAGKPLTVQEIAPLVYDKNQKGSLQMNMISASRRNGMMAVVIQGLPMLFNEIQAGHPVIVFENLAFSWFPQWHYALVFGYDFQRQEVILHSGNEAFKHWDIGKFERSWMLADYWGLVVLPPGQIAEAAGELANLVAAAGLEQANHLAEAYLSYTKIIEKWPTSLGALIGLGNIAYQKKEFAASVSFLRRAVKAHPNSAVAWHNLAIAQGAAKMKKEARQSAAQALQLASNEVKPAYQKDLCEWLSEN